jgi:hypothetical protein
VVASAEGLGLGTDVGVADPEVPRGGVAYNEGEGGIDGSEGVPSRGVYQWRGWLLVCAQLSQ